MTGILFKQDASKINLEKFQILEIALLDQEFKLKEVTKTWDYLRIRIHYYSPRKISNGSVILELSTSSGNKLLQYSTQPLSGLEMTFPEGESYTDCVIPCLPLSSGNYLISVGLAIPWSEWLCLQENMAVLEVSDYDVYKSKYPPRQERTTLAIEHYWELC